MPVPKFLYFDLGKVIVDFDVDVMCRQMGAAANISPELVFTTLFDTRLQERYESGEIDGRQFYEAFCTQANCRPDYDALELAGSDIFTLNVGILPVIAQLRAAGYRLGVLSNTCQSHWEHCLRRFRILHDLFSVHALSYRIRAAKPAPAIFRAAAELAGVQAREIFYTDDNAGHIAGAKAIGFDAVQYTSTPELVAELRNRGITFNY
ncbi:MAG: HAD family phosphatase [Pirellulales bacterium]|nr:HAD family phosphatase [Pirellulales bacterium]